MYRLFNLCLFFYIPFIQAVEPLNFKELTELNSYELQNVEIALENYLDKEVQIRGFIYENDAGQFVLSSKPDLESCCQKKEENIPHQIFLDGDGFKSTGGKTVSVQGFFTLQPVKDKEGNLIELYRLKEPKITHISNTTSWILLGVFALVLVLLGVTYRRSRRVH